MHLVARAAPPAGANLHPRNCRLTVLAGPIPARRFKTHNDMLASRQFEPVSMKITIHKGDK